MPPLCAERCQQRRIWESNLNLRKAQSASARRPLFRAGWDFEFLSLALELIGQPRQFVSRWIVPRQALCQPQAGFGFVPEISGIHRCIPVVAAPGSDCFQGKRQHTFRSDRDHRLSEAVVKFVPFRVLAIQLAVIFRRCSCAKRNRSGFDPFVLRK
jgi:hypothetical protein